MPSSHIACELAKCWPQDHRTRHLDDAEACDCKQKCRSHPYYRAWESPSETCLRCQLCTLSATVERRTLADAAAAANSNTLSTYSTMCHNHKRLEDVRNRTSRVCRRQGILALARQRARTICNLSSESIVYVSPHRSMWQATQACLWDRCSFRAAAPEQQAQGGHVKLARYTVPTMPSTTRLPVECSA